MELRCEAGSSGFVEERAVCDEITTRRARETRRARRSSGGQNCGIAQRPQTARRCEESGQNCSVPRRCGARRSQRRPDRSTRAFRGGGRYFWRGFWREGEKKAGKSRAISNRECREEQREAQRGPRIRGESEKLWKPWKIANGGWEEGRCGNR